MQYVILWIDINTCPCSTRNAYSCCTRRHPISEYLITTIILEQSLDGIRRLIFQ